MITSTANAAVKHIRGLRRRAERERTGLFYVEGLRHVGEAADTSAEVETCIVSPELLRSDYGTQVAARLQASGATLLEVSANVFQSLSSKDGPQGIAAVVRQAWTQLDGVDPGDGLCWVALAGVQDPGNLGTVLRTADAVGAAGVVLLGESTDPYDPAAVRASMGAVFSQRLVRAGEQGLLDWKARHGMHMVGTSDRAPIDYRTAEYPLPLILLMGSERAGLRNESAASCDSMVRIPMRGRCDSLNLSVATGVMLYEILRRNLARDLP